MKAFNLSYHEKDKEGVEKGDPGYCLRCLYLQVYLAAYCPEGKFLNDYCERNPNTKKPERVKAERILISTLENLKKEEQRA